MSTLPGNRTLIVQPLALSAFETTRLKRDTQAITNTGQMDVFWYCFVTTPCSVQAHERHQASLFTASRRHFRHDRHHNTWPFILPTVYSSYNEIAIGWSDLRTSDSSDVRKRPRNANSDCCRYTVLLTSAYYLCWCINLARVAYRVQNKKTIFNDDELQKTYSSEISPTRCNNCVFILRNGFTLHVSGDNLTHHQQYMCCIWPQVSRLT